MTQPHNKQPAKSKLELRLEMALRDKALTWDQCYLLLKLEAMLIASGPESNFASVLVQMLSHD